MGIEGLTKWQDVLDKLLHVLIVRTGPIDLAATLTLVKLVVIVLGFGGQAVGDAVLINRLQHAIVVQAAGKGVDGAR